MIGRVLTLASVAVISLATTASASVTLGETGPPPSSCGVSDDFLQPTVVSGATYVAPGDGTITSWSTFGPAAGSGQAKLKVFRQVSGNRYSVVTQDAFRTINSPGPFTRNVTIGGVEAGDVIGLTVTGTTGCSFASPGERYLLLAGDLSNGAAGNFNTSSPNFRVDVSAVLDPSHKFTLGAVRRNKKKGTATLTGSFPGPGSVTLTGKGLKKAGTPIAVGAKGDLGLPIKAKGSKRATLFDTGKVTLNISASYTPTGGTAGTAATKVKLKKKL